jgi:hypothetical protein
MGITGGDVVEDASIVGACATELAGLGDPVESVLLVPQARHNAIPSAVASSKHVFIFLSRQIERLATQADMGPSWPLRLLVRASPKALTTPCDRRGNRFWG